MKTSAPAHSVGKDPLNTFAVCDFRQLRLVRVEILALFVDNPLGVAENDVADGLRVTTFAGAEDQLGACDCRSA